MRFVNTNKAPTPVGPYSQGVQVGDFFFLSGQISIDPKTNELALFDGDITKQTKRVLENIRAVLQEAGLKISDVVKTTIYMTDLSKFGLLNEVYAEFFGGHKPARATVGVSALPRGVAVELDAIAYKKNSSIS